MYYTKKGDDGKTKIFDCDQRFSKSSAIAEALGSLDEINSYLGVIKSKIGDYKILDQNAKDLILRIQNNLFIIQAQVAGANKNINIEEIHFIEEVINNIEKSLPRINFFIISGANETSASFDFARTLARSAERRVVGVSDEGMVKLDLQTLVFLNRLSSMLYALARYTAKESGEESAPKY